MCVLYKYSTMQLDTFHFVNIACMYRRIDLSVQTTLSAPCEKLSWFPHPTPAHSYAHAHTQHS